MYLEQSSHKATQQWPHLAVWVWVRAAHGGSFILKYLHPFILLTQFLCLCHPPEGHYSLENIHQFVEK